MPKVETHDELRSFCTLALFFFHEDGGQLALFSIPQPEKVE